MTLEEADGCGSRPRWPYETGENAQCAAISSAHGGRLTWGSCGSVTQTTGSDDSVAPSQPVPETNSGDSSSWETARQSQDDPSSVKSAEDIAGNCVKDVGSKALMIRPLRAMPKLAPFL